MERLRGTGTSNAVARLALLRLAGAVVIAAAVVLGSPPASTGFLVALAIACAYALVLAGLALGGHRERPRPAISVVDVAFVALLAACSGGALSEARVGLVVYPIFLALALTPRAIALVAAVAAGGYALASIGTLDAGAARTAFAETLVAIVLLGAIGSALAEAIGRRAREVQELAVDRAALLHEALDAEERERARIGERLHDDTLQSLLAAQQDVREARAGYLQSLEYADEALTEAVGALRETVRGLHPTSLADRGLGVALQVEVERAARRAGFEFDLHVDPEAVGPHDALLFAAARELVTNAVKHARASHLDVRLERTADAVVLTVADDGEGMDAVERRQEAFAAGRVGLASMRHRVAAAGGELDILSAPGEGTTVLLTVPALVAERAAVAVVAEDPARVRELHASGLLDATPESGFDAVVRLAARLLDVPMALVTLVDAEREVLVAQVGVPEPFATRREWPLTHSLGRYAVANRAPLVSADVRSDPVLGETLAAGDLGIAACAALPLSTAAGHAIGTLTVADRRARPWTGQERELLNELARIAGAQIRLAERAARRGGDDVERERRFIAAVLESLGEGVVAADERGELRIVNAVARRYDDGLQLALGDLAERDRLCLASSGEAVAGADLPLRRALRGEVVAEEEYLAGDPGAERRWVVLAGRPIAASSGARGAIMTIRDVTEQRLAQRASQEAEERFRVAFEHAPVGMGIVGLDGRIWQANLALAELTGRSLAQLRRSRLDALLHPDEIEASAAGLRAVAAGSESVHATEKRLLHADGHEIPAGVHVAVIRDDGGRPQHFLLQLQDLTERRREEERLRTLTDRDELTLLLNRAGFARELRRHAARVERYGTDGGVLMLDVDGLGAINAALGRGGGDDVLRRFAGALESRVRRSDFAARVGEDEFAILVPHCDARALMRLAGDLLERLERAQSGSAERLGAPVTVSIGAALFGAGATEADTVWQRAATAMRASTRAGGNRATAFGPALLAAPPE